MNKKTKQKIIEILRLNFDPWYNGEDFGYGKGKAQMRCESVAEVILIALSDKEEQQIEISEDIFNDYYPEIKIKTDKLENWKKEIPVSDKEEREYYRNLPHQVSDKTIIKECLNYVAHRIKIHPDSGANVYLGRYSKRIDKLRKGEIQKEINFNSYTKGLTAGWKERDRKDKQQEPEYNWDIPKLKKLAQKVKHNEEPKKCEPMPNNADYSKTEDDIVDKINEVIDFLNK